MKIVESGLVALGREIRVQESQEAKPALSAREQPCRRESDKAPALPTLPERSWLYALEAKLEERLGEQLLGELRVLVQRFADEIDAKEARPRCPNCSCVMQRKRPCVKRTLRTRGGSFTFHRHEYWCPHCRVSRYPVDEALGLPARERWTPLTLSRLGCLTTIVPFEQGADLANSFLGVEVSKQATWNIAQRLGKRLEEYREKQAVACGDVRSCPELPRATSVIPQIAVDGAMVLTRADQAPQPPPTLEGEDPLEEESRPRCRGREVKSAVVTLPVRPTGPGEKEPRRVRRAVVSVLGNADQLWSLLWAALVVGGLIGAGQPVAIIGDGAPWIWERAKLFVKRIEILDFWHAAEHAWRCARVLWGEGTKATERWARRIRRMLLEGKVGKVIEELRLLRQDLPKQGATMTAISAVDKLLRYYVEHAHRMNYPYYRDLGLSIGSGAVESVHRQIVHVRMRQAGMRWSIAGARRMVLLREAYVRGAWGEVERLCARRAA